MKIAIHQPNFFPWIGYFFKIKMADTFVFLDDVEFTKQSFTKRVRINHQADFSLGRYLSIPLQNHSDQSLIKDIVVSSEHISNWWREMIAIVHNTYCHSPYYQETMTFLQTVVQKVETEKKLTTVNQIVIAEIADYLDLETDFILSSNFLISSLYSFTILLKIESISSIFLFSRFSKTKFFFFSVIKFKEIKFFVEINTRFLSSCWIKQVL